MSWDADCHRPEAWIMTMLIGVPVWKVTKVETVQPPMTIEDAIHVVADPQPTPHGHVDDGGDDEPVRRVVGADRAFRLQIVIPADYRN